MKLVHVYRYREKFVNGAKIPLEHKWATEIKNLIPKEKRDNHQVAIVDMGDDSWGHNCEVAVFFHDCDVIIGSLDQVRDGDVSYNC